MAETPNSMKPIFLFDLQGKENEKTITRALINNNLYYCFTCMH